MSKYFLLSFPCISFGLGVWQIKRLEWKKALIANLEAQLQSDPVQLTSIESLNEIQDTEYRRIKARGKFVQEYDRQAYLKPKLLLVNDEALRRGHSAASHMAEAGVNVITPFEVADSNLRILVNRGWLPAKGSTDVTELAKAGLGKPNEIQNITGIYRKSEGRPQYGADHILSKREFCTRDIETISKFLETDPIWLDLEQDVERTDGPIGGQTRIKVRNEHLNYAITWFALSILSYLLWRTRFGRGKRFSNVNKTY